MKIFLAVVLAVGISVAGTYFVVSNMSQSKLKAQIAQREAQWQAEKAALEAELAAARNQEPLIQHVKTEVAVGQRRSPKQILELLHTLKPVGTARIATIRKIVHELEELAEWQDKAVPEIRDFLARNEDLDYSMPRTEGEDGGDRRFSPPWARSTPQTEFTLPPSMRIGLVDVLREIGSEEAEQVLAGVLGTSGRAVEVAYLARMLEEMAPGKYREIALNAAKDLLRNPLAIDNPNRLDEQAEGYLYGILELYNDTSFIDEAKRLLVNSDGRMNRNAQHYLTKTQGENVVATFYDVYKNNVVSNTWDKVSVANRILDFAGPNQQENAFFKEIITSSDIDSRMRSFAVMRLAGGFGGMDSPTDPNVIRSRMELLDSLAPVITDERLQSTVKTTRQNLENLQNGKPVENPWRGGRDRGDGSSPQRPN